jgi:hypothetical protein
MALNTGLISYYSFDDTSDSAGTNTLTNHSATFVTGKVGNAANFVAASSQYTSLASNSSVQTGDIDFSLAAWVKLSSKGAIRPIVTKWNNTLNKREYALYYDNSSNAFVFQVSSNGTATALIAATALGSPSLNTQYYVVAWHDSVLNTINICVNNGTVNSAAYSAGVFVSDSELRIGGAVAIGGAQQYMDGQLDEVLFSKRIFTSAEITDLFNANAGRNYAYIAGATITIAGSVVSTSNLELSVNLVDNSLNFASAFRTAALTNLAGVYGRSTSFVGGFGENDPLFDWDGTGALPTTYNEIRGGVNVFNMNGIDRFLTVASTLAISLDWIFHRLPWQFTYNPGTGVNSVKTDYYGSETRRIRLDKFTEYATYVRLVAAYLIAHGARRFKFESEMKGYQTDKTNNLPQTVDYIAFHTVYDIWWPQILLGADDAVVSRSLISVGGPYTAHQHKGALNTTTSVNFDTRATNTSPTETIRYKDDAATPLWSLNNPGWGYPEKDQLQGLVEFFKISAANSSRVDMFCKDLGSGSIDFILKQTDDFYNAEHRVRDHARFDVRLLNDVSSGQFAGLKTKRDWTEFYIKPQGTVANTANTLASDNVTPPPGPYLPVDQLRPYFAALKAVACCVAIEEGLMSINWWGYDGAHDGRSYPQLTGGQDGDGQRVYGEAIVAQGRTGDGGAAAGTLTVVGAMFKLFTTHFPPGTPIRAVTVSDTSKAYALPNLTDCIVINKTGSSLPVSVNGTTATLTPYETRSITYAIAYGGTIAATLPSFTASGAGTFTTPTYSGAAALTMPSLTLVAIGTFVTPAYNGIATLTMPSLTASASGTFDTPAYTGTADLTLPSFGLDAEGYFVTPAFSGTADLTLPSFTIDATGLYNVVAYTGSVNLTLPSLTVDATGDYTNPAYEGIADLALPSFTIDIDGDYIPPAITGTLALLLPMFIIAASGRVSDAHAQALYVEAIVEAISIRLADVPVTFVVSAETETIFTRSAVVEL